VNLRIRFGRLRDICAMSPMWDILVQESIMRWAVVARYTIFFIWVVPGNKKHTKQNCIWVLPGNKIMWQVRHRRILEKLTWPACSGGRIVSWIIYCWLVWCERKILFLTRNLRSFTSKRTCRHGKVFPERFLSLFNCESDSNELVFSEEAWDETVNAVP